VIPGIKAVVIGFDDLAERQQGDEERARVKTIYVSRTQVLFTKHSCVFLQYKKMILPPRLKKKIAYEENTLFTIKTSLR
jgi:hypothetical protein